MFRNGPVYEIKENPFFNFHFHFTFTLRTKFTIHIQIEKFLDGLTKGFTNMVKDNGAHHILSKSVKYRNGCDPHQLEKLKLVIFHSLITI